MKYYSYVMFYSTVLYFKFHIDRVQDGHFLFSTGILYEPARAHTSLDIARLPPFMRGRSLRLPRLSVIDVGSSEQSLKEEVSGIVSIKIHSGLLWSHRKRIEIEWRPPSSKTLI